MIRNRLVCGVSDTGASLSLINEVTYILISSEQPRPTDIKLHTNTAEVVQVLSLLQYESQTSKLPVMVVAPNLFGRNMNEQNQTKLTKSK